MAILRIWQDSRRLGTCRSCGAPIEWAELITGSRMPFNAPITVLRSQDELLSGGRTIEDVDTAISVSHFATCRDAKDWRRR